MAVLDYVTQLGQPPFMVLEVFTYALLGGLLPALIWLWFWMHESHHHDEPKLILWLTFILGMTGVFLVFPLQSILGYLFEVNEDANSISAIVIWAGLEELIKYIAAYAIALRIKPKIFDEPIDAFVYLMTAALGFSALENTLFLITPLLQGDTIASIITGNMRFMGANLLHVASSGVLSIFIALSYYKTKIVQYTWTILGLIVATLLHALFNFLIILLTSVQKGMIFVAFSYVWITLIILILALEKVKKVKQF